MDSTSNIIAAGYAESKVVLINRESLAADEEGNTIVEAVDDSGTVLDSDATSSRLGTLRATWC